jgi:hypothetical protein
LLLGSVNGGFLVNMLSKLNKLFRLLDTGTTQNRYLLNFKSARKVNHPAKHRTVAEYEFQNIFYSRPCLNCRREENERYENIVIFYSFFHDG